MQLVPRAIVTSLLALFFILPLPADSANILGLFQHPGKSHFDFFRPLFLGLAATGHNVTMISYFPNKVPVANYTDIVLTGMPILANNVDIQAFGEGTSPDSIPFKIPTFFMLHDWSIKSCTVAFESDIIKNLLKTPRFSYDVIILEQFANDCMMAVAHLLQAPIIALSSCAIMPWHYRRMGSPNIPSFMPMNFLPYTDEMNFVARLNNFLHFHVVNFLYDYITQRETNALIRKHYGTSIPPVEDLVKTTRLMLINQHFSLTGVIPYSPSVIEVGGMQIQNEQPIETSLKTLLDSSPNGVIYISFGSMIIPDTLPHEKRDALLNSIAKFPEYLFLLKWSNESLPNKPKNLHTRTWMPQRDILCHPNIKAFIAHGGLLGTSESLYCGIPMLVTPFLGDQFLNSVFIEKHKLGVIVNYKEFTESNIVNGLQNILKPAFSKNVKLLAETYRNRAVKPLDLAIWWVEHIIQTKGATLAQSSLRNSNWLIDNSFDIYLFVLTLVLALITLTKMLINLCRSVCKKTTNRKLKIQ